MSVSVDLRVLHLLCSRLCHDLVGPVGAINNGVELVREFGAGNDDEAMDLVASSARQIANRLKFFRVAYGLAVGTARNVRDVRDLSRDAVASGRVTLDWPADQAIDMSGLAEGSVKLLLNMVLLGTEALSPSGTIRVGLTSSAGGIAARVAANGQGARLDDETMAGLADSADLQALTPRSIQGYFTARLAESEGTKLGVAVAEGNVTLDAVLRPAD